MTQKTAFELLVEAIETSSATIEEKIKMIECFMDYIEYKYQQNLNAIR